MVEPLESKVARLEVEMQGLLSRTSKVHDQFDDVRLTHIKKADLNESKNEILSAINTMRSDLLEKHADLSVAHDRASTEIKVLVSRADAQDRELAEVRGALKIVTWVARTALGGLITAAVMFAWHKLTGG